MCMWTFSLEGREKPWLQPGTLHRCRRPSPPFFACRRALPSPLLFLPAFLPSTSRGSSSISALSSFASSSGSSFKLKVSVMSKSLISVSSTLTSLFSESIMYVSSTSNLLTSNSSFSLIGVIVLQFSVRKSIFGTNFLFISTSVFTFAEI